MNLISGNTNDDTVITYCVKKMSVQLAMPENVFMSQGDTDPEKCDSMFFIAKGNCIVKVRSVYGMRYEEK